MIEISWSDSFGMRFVCTAEKFILALGHNQLPIQWLGAVISLLFEGDDCHFVLVRTTGSICTLPNMASAKHTGTVLALAC